MPRDSNGVYTLPVTAYVNGTTITATDMNSNLDDLGDEIQNSLARDGKGGMTAPLRTADGSAAAPAHSFTNDTGVGIYRKSSGVGAIAAGGGDVATFSSSGLFIGSSTTPVPSSLPTAVVISANRTTTSSSFSNVTDASFTVAASGVYVWEAILDCNISGNDALVVQWTGPAAPTRVNVRGIGLTVGGAAAVFGESANAFSASHTVLDGVAGGAGDWVSSIAGVLVNGANAGTVQLQFKSSMGAATSTIYRGSIIRWQKVA